MCPEKTETQEKAQAQAAASQEASTAPSEENKDTTDAQATVCVRTYRLEDFEAYNELNQLIFILDCDPDNFKHIWANSAYLKVYGSTLEEYIAKDVGAMCSPAVRAFTNKLYQMIQVKHEAQRQTKTMYPGGKALTLDCQLRPVNIILPGHPEGKTVIIWECSPVDRDDQNKMDLSRSNELIQYSAVPSMIFKLDGTCLYENLASKVFYYGKDGAGGYVNGRKVCFNDVLESAVWNSEQDREDLLKRIKALEDKDTQVEWECKKKARGEAHDGHEIRETWHRVIITRIQDPVTTEKAHMVNEYCISELKMAQAELVRASVAKEAFFAATSHELRTPLNGIIGLSEGLSHNPNCTPEMKKGLKAIQSSGRRLAALVNDLLDLAAARERTLIIKHEEVNVSQVVDTVCEMCLPLMKGNVKLINTVNQSTVPTIQGDANRINQILTNLVSNAIKFTHHGEIKVSAAQLKKDRRIRISVTDTGIGIPKDKLETIWNAFSQVDVGTARKYGGTGLGLSVVKELVKAHKGDVTVASVCEGTKTGTTFTVLLPLRQKCGDSEDGVESLRHAAPEGCDSPSGRNSIQGSARRLSSTQGRGAQQDSLSETASCCADACEISCQTDFPRTSTSMQTDGTESLGVLHDQVGTLGDKRAKQDMSTQIKEGCADCKMMMEKIKVLITTYEDLRGSYIDNLEKMDKLKLEYSELKSAFSASADRADRKPQEPSSATSSNLPANWHRLHSLSTGNLVPNQHNGGRSSGRYVTRAKLPWMEQNPGRTAA